jgi:predicted nucleotidyltransferase
MRNIPSDRKEILEKFVTEISQALGSRVLGLYLFGSTAKGTARPESDMDILIIYTEMTERELLETAADISFEIACEHGQLIEVIPMAKEEYEQSLGRSPFLWEVMKFGIPELRGFAPIWNTGVME